MSAGFCVRLKVHVIVTLLEKILPASYATETHNFILFFDFMVPL